MLQRANLWETMNDVLKASHKANFSVTSKNASKTFTLRHNMTNFCTVNNVACYDMFPVGTTGIPPHPTSEQPE